MQSKQVSVWGTKAELRARVGRSQISWSPAAPPPVILLLAVPGRLFCFGSLTVLDVCGYVLWFLLDIEVENM